MYLLCQIIAKSPVRQLLEHCIYKACSYTYVRMYDTPREFVGFLFVPRTVFLFWFDLFITNDISIDSEGIVLSWKSRRSFREQVERKRN